MTDPSRVQPRLRQGYKGSENAENGQKKILRCKIEHNFLAMHVRKSLLQFLKASFRPASAEPINIDIIKTQKRENRLLHKLSGIICGSFHGVCLTLLQTYILQNTPLTKVKIWFLQFILCQNCSLRHSKTNLLNYLTKNKVISKFDKSVRLTFEIPLSKF